jgi:N-acyl-D-amino-acid deacylase
VLELKIAGGQVLDGTGAPSFAADVGITGDSITTVGDLSREPAGQTIDAAGLTVAPGFIDIHSHSDWRLFANRRAESKIRQGVTTEVVGNCGFSPAPVSDEFRQDMQGFALYVGPGMDFSWSSVKDFLRRYEDDGLALNVAQLIGHGTLRLGVMGFARRAPSAKELARMRTLMESAMADGACGLSTGLIYAPGSYAQTPEIVEIARGAARGGFYASHIRGEGATLLQAVAEAISVGSGGGLPVQVSHIKAAGRPHWGQVKEALALIDGARAKGLDVTADVYPYTASSTTIRTLLPDSALEGGIEAMLGRLREPAARAQIRDEMARGPVLARGVGWEDIMIAYAPSRPEIQGLRLDEIGRRWSKDPVECAFDIIEAEKGKGYVILFQLDEADLRLALLHPHVMIGSDGSSLATAGPLSEGKPHPRSYGTFPRVLGRYARDERLLTLPAAIHKMTGMPAARLGLKDRGAIREGARADVVVFSPERVADPATYEDPHRYALGIPHVVVNGRIVIKDGQHTGLLPGRVLRPAPA